jgi:hypothetical protein
MVDDGSSDVRRPCATVCVVVMFGRICVVADQWAPQSLDENQLRPLTWIGTTTRPHVPGGEPGAGGCTSGTPPMPPVRPACAAVADAVGAPSTCARVSAGVKLTPVPAAPAVPTVVIVTSSCCLR